MTWENIPGLCMPGYTEAGLRDVVPYIEKYKLSHEILSFDRANPLSGTGFSLYLNDKNLILEARTYGNAKLIAVGRSGLHTAIVLHTFLLQYRKPGFEVPNMPRDYGPEYGVFDETWKLRLLLMPVTTREQLLERLAEANVMARQCYPEHITPDYTKSVSFGEQSYAKYQAYLKRYGMPPGPDEPPVDTRESIVAWLSQSRMRYEDRIVGARTVEIWCSNCMIDRRDGSWSIYGWNDGDGVNRYPPDELVRYYDEAMAYEYLLNAVLDAVVTY